MNALELVKSIRPGDTVSARFSNGLGEKKVRTGKVSPLLIFRDHVVINLGGPYGTPGVVTADNIVSVKSGSVVRSVS